MTIETLGIDIARNVFSFTASTAADVSYLGVG